MCVHNDYYFITPKVLSHVLYKPQMYPKKLD